jgi:recombination protein RecA
MSTESKLEKTLDLLNKAYGKGSVVRLGEKADKHVEVISSGCMSLNLALGVGGYAKGRIVEIFGGESSGKTTITIHAIAEVQKAGGIAAVIDYEHAFDTEYAQALGVDIDRLIFCQPSNAEEGLEIADKLIETGEIAIVVIDSVAAMVPKSELEGEMGDSKMGIHARLMSQALRKMTGKISKTNTLCIFINQTREKIGVMFGNPTTTTGGNALKFYASQRLEVSRSQGDKDKDGNVINSKVKVKVIKNKVAQPFKVAEFNILFGVGIDRIGEIMDFAVEFEIIKKSGSWFSYEGNKLGQGEAAVKALLDDNPELIEEIEKKVLNKLSN